MKDVARTFAGGTPSRSDATLFGGPVPWVKSAEVANGLIISTEESLTELGLASSAAKWCKPGSTLVAMYGANAGQVGRLGIRAATNQAVLCIEASSPEDQAFLYHAVSAAAPKLLGRTQGSGQPNLNASIIRSLELPWPDSETRDRVARCLDLVGTMEGAISRSLTAKRAFKRALMNDLLTGRRRFPEFEGNTRAIVRLGNACEIQIGGTPSRSEPRYWSESNDGLPWVSIADLRGPLVLATKERITPEGARNSNAKLVTAGTVLMSFKLTIGRTAIAGCDLYTNEAIAAITPRDDRLLPCFLFELLPLAVLSANPDTAVKGATLNKAKLAEILLRLPSIEEQRRICQVADSLAKNIAVLERTMLATADLKRGLMQRLLSGEVEIPKHLTAVAAEAEARDDDS